MSSNVSFPFSSFFLGISAAFLLVVVGVVCFVILLVGLGHLGFSPLTDKPENIDEFYKIKMKTEGHRFPTAVELLCILSQ